MRTLSKRAPRRNTQYIDFYVIKNATRCNSSCGYHLRGWPGASNDPFNGPQHQPVLGLINSSQEVDSVFARGREEEKKARRDLVPSGHYTKENPENPTISRAG